MQNIEIASRFEEVAELLSSQAANPYRAHAYCQGRPPLGQTGADIYRNDGKALTNLPGSVSGAPLPPGISS